MKTNLVLLGLLSVSLVIPSIAQDRNRGESEAAKTTEIMAG
jgi:hypothetical protein